MTIFILGTPEETAKALDNKSLGKMISDIADVLRYTCLASIYDPFESGEKEWFRVTALIGNITITREHKLYDWTTWTRTCRANYLALVKYAQACCDEFEYRNNETKILYGRKYIKYENGELKEYEYKLHKQHDVIRWCELNSPALPSNSTYECLLPDYSSLKAEPWPLVMPEKYFYQPLLFFADGNVDAEIDVIESYRAYYKAKLRKKICPKCVTGMSKEGCGKNNILWTRREKPEFIK